MYEEDAPIIYGVGSAAMFSDFKSRRKKRPIGFAPPPPAQKAEAKGVRKKRK